MKTFLSERIMNLSESQTLTMAKRSRELKAQGLDIINLCLGEPDFNTPDFIKKAAHTAIDDNFSHYMPVPGYLDLRQAISEKLEKQNQLHYPPGQIIVSTGAKQSLANAMLCLLNPGDEVLLPAPYWVTYIEIIKLCGAKPIIIKTSVDDDFKVTASQLRQHITDRTKLLLYSSPCNPSGSVYSASELYEIAKVVEAHRRLFVLSDEIYEYINYIGPHVSIASFDHIRERVIIVNGVSKAFAMTGWRVGYMAGPAWLIEACIKMQGQITSGACGIAQKAAKAALSGDNREVQNMRDIFLQRRNLVLDLLKDIKDISVNTPQGAFYVFPDISKYFGRQYKGGIISDANELSMYLLDHAHVAVVSGSAFGDDNCIRISFAASENDLKRALGRMKTALENLR